MALPAEIMRTIRYSDCGQVMYNTVHHRAHVGACRYCQNAIRACRDSELQGLLLVLDRDDSRYAIALDELNRRAKENAAKI